MGDWIEYIPAGGWAAFARSEALTAALWDRLPAGDWHYLNFAAGSSVWESRRDASMVSVHYEGEQAVHLAARGGAAEAVASHLAVEFGLAPAAAAYEPPYAHPQQTRLARLLPRTSGSSEAGGAAERGR